VRRLHSIYGAGEVRAVIFPIVPWAGVSQCRGIVVSQQQYGMRAQKFRITERHVRYLKQRRIFTEPNWRKGKTK